jgi:hypothetical protein
MMTPQVLEKAEMYALTGEDIKTLVGPVRIITYPKLKDETWETLFKEQPYVVILFLTEDENTGHWQCVLQHDGGNKVEVFDSFGITVDGNRRWLSKDRLQDLGQTLPLMHKVFEGFPGELIYNDTKLQQDSRNTCGRHIACRILYNRLSIQDYINTIKASGDNPDEFVTLKTYRILHK